MINFDDRNENMKECNPYYPQIPYYPYRILITGGSGIVKSNSFFNLKDYQPNIDRIYLYAKDPLEAKHQLLIK